MADARPGRARRHADPAGAGGTGAPAGGRAAGLAGGDFARGHVHSSSTAGCPRSARRRGRRGRAAAAGPAGRPDGRPRGDPRGLAGPAVLGPALLDAVRELLGAAGSAAAGHRHRVESCTPSAPGTDLRLGVDIAGAAAGPLVAGGTVDLVVAAAGTARPEVLVELAAADVGLARLTASVGGVGLELVPDAGAELPILPSRVRASAAWPRPPGRRPCGRCRRCSTPSRPRIPPVRRSVRGSSPGGSWPAWATRWRYAPPAPSTETC